MIGNPQGRTEPAVADVRPAAVIDPAGTAILDNFLRAHYLRTLTTDGNDHTIE
ncbi:hypothetical protein [Rhodococcus sp. T7]|uniref:hypothetical protein n=1 Tax=Rhodococcus sp. T7 TaxID=627444 RepID=UPI00135C8CEB|nr:hypothetical protein [Rhodococcus sp. T7]KAF0957356.1 hypothetical protein MLGJGCBP_09187 [Rhodococcus sp. T7]KAF0966724.1 hypothetical protein MLGJGCBP_00098 [Rhodococcus sp. T7]